MTTTSRYVCIYPVLFVIILLSLATISSAQTITHQVSLPAGQSWCEDSIINGLASTLNGFRVQHGVPALAMNSLGIRDADLRAIQFSQYMQTHTLGSPGFNPHTGYDTTAASIGYPLISENLSYQDMDPNYIVYVGWQDSLHLATMLAPDANVMGISCVYLGGTPYLAYEPGACSNSCGGSSPAPTPSPSPTPTPTPTPTPVPTGTPTLDSEESAFVTMLNAY